MSLENATTNHGFGETGTTAIRLLCCERRRVDLGAIRRELAETMLAWPGDERDRWWKWLVEAGRGLSYAARVIEASPREVQELLRHGVEAVCTYAEAGGRLLVLTGIKRRKIRLSELPGDAQGRFVSRRELKKLLGGGKSTEPRRWVILDPVADDVPFQAKAAGHGAPPGRHAAGEVKHDHPSPWSRLREFLRPEWSDIWMVLVFALVNGMLTLATPIAVEALVNTVAFGTLLQPLVVLSIILLTFLGFAAALRFLQRFVVELIQGRLFARVAARLAWQLPRVRLDRAPDFTAQLLNRFFDVVTMQKIVAQLALDGLTVLLTLGLGMVVLAFYHPWLLAFDLVLLIMLALNVFVLGRGAVRTSIAESQCKYAVAGWLEDIARCPTTFKSAGGLELALARADRLTSDYLLARRAHYRVLMRQILSGLALEALASAALLGLGGFLVIQGQMTLGQLVAAELIVTLIVAAVAKLDKQFEGFYDLLTSMDKLGHLFDLPVEPPSGVMNVGRAGGASVALRGVRLSREGERRSPGEWTLEAAGGEVVAVVGPVGCGKSSLLDMLFGLRSAEEGRVVLDDQDLGDLRPDALRQHVALVRGAEIVPGSLAENVHLDRTEISSAQVREALRRVGLESESARRTGEQASEEAAPDAHGSGHLHREHAKWSLETQLAPNGRPLSESQARLLMLARAMVGQPRLLLVDDLLDLLPDDDAQRLIEEFKRMRSSCTVLIATRRRAIAQQCDRTWEL